MVSSRKCNVGMTLVEVLITLGIIGVVSAMTIPNLINNVIDKGFHEKAKKFYSTFSSATAQMINDNGNNIWNNSDTDGAILSKNMRDEYKKYFENIKEGSDLELRTNNWYGYKSSSVVMDPYAYRSSAVLTDGTYMYFYSNQNCSDAIPSSDWFLCGAMTVDVNGNDKPNMFGKDVYAFDVLKNSANLYKVVPCGNYRNLTCEAGSTSALTSLGCTEKVINGEKLP